MKCVRTAFTHAVKYKVDKFASNLEKYNKVINWRSFFSFSHGYSWTYTVLSKRYSVLKFTEYPFLRSHKHLLESKETGVRVVNKTPSLVQ